MLSRVLDTIREHGLVREGEAVLVGVSGGPDSTALLHALVKLAPRLGIRVRAASVDHALRPEAAAETAVVASRCADLGVPCERLVVDVAQARRRHGSLQQAARDVRLAALEQAAARLGCTRVALGHNADDQAETVLFRVLRGTGLAGLTGIPYQRGIFVRPLLDVRRAEIVAFLGKRKLAFATDPSNADRRYARARIRHDVLPMLARENPRVVEALLALARHARGEPERAWRRLLPAGLYLPDRVLTSMDRWVARADGTRQVAVPGGAIVVRYGAVSWSPGSAACREAPASSAEPMPVAGEGIYRLGGSGAGIEIAARPTAPADGAAFDWQGLVWPLELRRRRPGDRLRPRDGRGSRKLSDMLVDAKIARDERAALPVLCDGTGDVLFVPGLRPSELARPSASTRTFCVVRVAR